MVKITTAPPAEGAGRIVSLDILRITMAILVVANHTESYNYFVEISPFFHYVRLLAVPVFIMLAAYLTPWPRNDPEQKSPLIRTLRRRVKRIYTPVIVWSLVYFAPSYPKVNLRNVVYQLVFGHTVDPVLYYLVILLWLTVFFLGALSCLSRRKGTYCLLLIIALCLMAQRSGINWSLFSDFGDQSRWTLGRICELMPFFAIGMLLRQYRIRVFSLRNIMISSGLVIVAYCSRPFDETIGSFLYAGISILLGASMVFLTFVNMNVRLGRKLAKCIEILSSITLGVCCLHILVIGVCSRFLTHFHLLLSPNARPLQFLCIIVSSFASSYLLQLLLRKYSQNIIR